jgi:hypothetical protein
MASLIYNSAIDDIVRGVIDCDADTFYLMLVTSAYTPNKDTHMKRSDVTNEVTGTGYTSGGKATAATVTKDTANDREDITFASTTWPAATITARAGVIYKRRGGVASADELVAYVDFGSDIVSTLGDFAVNFLTPFRFQN